MLACEEKPLCGSVPGNSVEILRMVLFFFSQEIVNLNPACNGSGRWVDAGYQIMSGPLVIRDCSEHLAIDVFQFIEIIDAPARISYADRPRPLKLGVQEIQLISAGAQDERRAVVRQAPRPIFKFGGRFLEL